MGWFVFDTGTIVYFILSLTWPAKTPLLTAVDYRPSGLLILLDLAARFWISENRRKGNA